MPLCNDNPQPLGVVASGTSPRSSRCDHVHPFPTGAKVVQTVAQSFPTGVNTLVIYDTVLWDDQSYYSIASPGNFFAPVSGRYLLIGSWSFVSSGLGTIRQARFIRNSTVITGARVPVTANALAALSDISAIILCDAGDSLSMELTHDVGANLNSNPVGELVSLSIQRVS